MTAFVDTSAFYAVADRGDMSHDRATTLLSDEDDLLTSDHVLVETWTLVRYRLGRSAADRFWDGVHSGAAALETVGSADLEVAWAIGRAFPDQDFSIVDRTSVAVMERLGVHRAISFDDDFLIYRFGPRRQRAFDVLR